jgi:glutathionylspermidine synthase
VFVEDVGWNNAPDAENFVGFDQQKIENWFKLYPWEFLIDEEFSEYIVQKPPRVTLEPPWKLLLSNKSLLPVGLHFFGSFSVFLSKIQSRR